MRIGRLLACSLALVIAGATGAAAQDSGKVGITMGYPAAVGIIWHLGDTVALRPELTFSGSSSETDRAGNVIDIESDGWAFGTGISALFYLHQYDRVRTYFSPRFTYTKIKTTSSSSNGVFDSRLDLRHRRELRRRGADRRQVQRLRRSRVRVRPHHDQQLVVLDANHRQHLGHARGGRGDLLLLTAHG